MSKKLLQRITPSNESIKNNKHIQIFGKLLHTSYLWHLTRHSASKAFAIGLFVTLLPIPFHMVIAAASAIVFRANLPLAIALVWINNPFTVVPVFYFGYLLGARLMGISVQPFDLSWPEGTVWDWLTNTFVPCLFGCLICSVVFSLLGYFSIDWLWRWHIIHRWQQRNKQRLMRSPST
jgi:uncharacterized protein (DUF2062 family)